MDLSKQLILAVALAVHARGAAAAKDYAQILQHGEIERRLQLVYKGVSEALSKDKNQVMLTGVCLCLIGALLLRSSHDSNKAPAGYTALSTSDTDGDENTGDAIELK